MAPTPRNLSLGALSLPWTQSPLHSPKYPMVICKIRHYSKCTPLVFCNHMRSNLWKFTCTGHLLPDRCWGGGLCLPRISNQEIILQQIFREHLCGCWHSVSC